jgi:hypothetical protein
VKVCDIKADMSNLSGALERVSGTKGIWWQLNYEIGIQFGATELSAKMYWKENVRRRPFWSHFFLQFELLYFRRGVNAKAT